MVPVAAKAGALLAVAAAGSTSIWYFSDSIFGTSLVSIADETPTPATYGNTSIGKNYSKYFLSSKNNKKTWEKRHKEHVGRFSGGSEASKDKFSTVTEGYSDTESSTKTSLNKICEEAYKEIDTNKLVDAEPGSTDANKFFKTNVWEFCGLGKIVTLDKEPSSGSSTAYAATNIGGADTEKKLFVSTKVKDNVNDWFWNLKTKEFWSGQAKIEGTEKDKNVFKKLKEEGAKNTNIKETCEAAYNKTTAEDSGKKNKEDALTFCSIRLQLTSVSS